MYTFVGGALEIVSYLAIWPGITYLGRRNCLVLTYIVGAASLFGVMGLQISGYDGEWVRVHTIAWVYILQVGQSIK